MTLQKHVPKASVMDTVEIMAEVLVPTVAQGVILRRPQVVKVAERLDLTRRAIARLVQTREKYGPGPVLLSKPGQPRAIVLAPDHVRRVLEETPETFKTGSSEKRAALSHFEPKNALISDGRTQEVRHRLNDQVLESDAPAHRLSARFLAVIDEEVEYLHNRVRRQGVLEWADFFDTWFRMVRRITFGESAADDRELIDMVERLRGAANWAFMHPGRPGLRRRFLARVKEHLDHGEPGSLAEVIQSLPRRGDSAPHHQVPQYLFAFDATAMTVFRALAMLAGHPDHAERALKEVGAHPGAARAEMPFLRACVLETLRLWPTSPLILREARHDVTFGSGVLPAGTSVLIYTPFFHRDTENVPGADRFSPERWLEEAKPDDWPLLPFGGGRQLCPGRNLVLLTTTAMIAALIEGREFRLQPTDRVDRHGRLPSMLSPYTLAFRFGPRAILPTPEGAPPRGAEGAKIPVPLRGVPETTRTAR
jgi:hypothetical protein